MSKFNGLVLTDKQKRSLINTAKNSYEFCGVLRSAVLDHAEEMNLNLDDCDVFDTIRAAMDEIDRGI